MVLPNTPQAPIPPELLGIPALPAGPTPLPAPTVGPDAMAGLVMGQLGGQFPPTDPLMADFGDPTLSALSQSGYQAPFDPLADLPESQMPGYLPLPDEGAWREVANADEELYKNLSRRFSRDQMLYRQKWSQKPPGFDPKREMAFKSATVSNIVNKLTNMSAPMDFRYEVPFKDETSKRNSQILENWFSYLRKCEEIEYAEAGGGSSLQWDEFFYIYLRGRVCCRILPYEKDPAMPFHVSLIDPALVFPIWGGDKGGLVRVTHKRQMSAIDVIATYLEYDPEILPRMQRRIIEDFGLDSTEYRQFFHQERELVECWDTWNKFVSWGDVTIQNTPHRLGYVPWVYVLAKGEPRGMVTPEGRYQIDAWEDEDPEDPGTWRPVSNAADMVEKGVSVFHHIINTNRMTEVVYTLLMTEIIKASDPATITYSAAQMAGQAPPPLNFKPGGNNQRTLNAQKVEIAPTSPRPTDTSPVLGKLTGDITEGSVNPAMYGAVEGSNIAGFAIESMIAAAKDTVLPYLRAFEIYQQLKARLFAAQYRDVIAPLAPMSVPMEGKYGSSPAADLTPEVFESVGTKVTCEIVGVSDQQLPMMVNAAGAAVERGFWSRRKAMEKLGEKDPSRMIGDIIIERALEHPEMMENFLIPINFIRAGQKDLADLWVLMVVMPKIQMLMAKMLGGAAQGAMAGVQQSGASMGPAAAPPELNGQSNPMAMRAMGPPTGPAIGQGRGAAPERPF